MRKHSFRKRQAFTLIEVMLVIGILLVLGTVSVLVYTGMKAKADKNAAKLLVDNVAQAVKHYQIAMGSFPETDPGLKALIDKPEDEKQAEKWTRLLDSVPKDPWGEDLEYEYVGTNDTGGPEFHVWSTGPDKQDGTDDDIRSWSEAQQ